jgi:hypothetical protein
MLTRIENWFDFLKIAAKDRARGLDLAEATLAPSAMSDWASANPSPSVPPVMMKALPASSRSMK